jgi:cell division protein FtsA
MSGILELAKKNLRLPVQIGFPTNVTTVIDRVEDPAFATAVGLVLWAYEYSAGAKGGSKLNLNIFNGDKVDKVKKLFKKFLP